MRRNRKRRRRKGKKRRGEEEEEESGLVSPSVHLTQEQAAILSGRPGFVLQPLLTLSY